MRVCFLISLSGGSMQVAVGCPPPGVAKVLLGSCDGCSGGRRRNRGTMSVDFGCFPAAPGNTLLLGLWGKSNSSRLLRRRHCCSRDGYSMPVVVGCSGGGFPPDALFLGFDSSTQSVFFFFFFSFYIVFECNGETELDFWREENVWMWKVCSSLVVRWTLHSFWMQWFLHWRDGVWFLKGGGYFNVKSLLEFCAKMDFFVSSVLNVWIGWLGFSLMAFN